MFTSNTSLIIPTRNRSDKIIFLLNQIIKKKINFKEIIIVDSSDKHHKNKINLYIKKKKIKLFNTFPSTTHQRNVGLKKAKLSSKYILFFDDDIKIHSKSFEQMNTGIRKYAKFKNICSFGFNLISGTSKNKIESFKESKFMEFIGLYSKVPGTVLKSGWHTKISDLKKDTYVEWMYSGATLFEARKIKGMRFANLNKGFNYLEDLHFSYELTKKKFKHIVISKAMVYNYNFAERNDFNFGLIEIINRYKFVKKYNKKKLLFYFTAIVRMIYLIKNIPKFKLSWVFRFVGNCAGLLLCLKLDLNRI